MEGSKLKIGCVVMAAGRSVRFGRNKLMEELGGRSLVSRALDAVPTDNLYKVVVVTGYPEVQALAAAKNFECVWNDRPEEGQSFTIRLGLGMLQDADAALFMVCDQPLLTRASVSAEVDFYRKKPDYIVSMACGGVRGNPCIFPAQFFPELNALRGDTGGSAVIKKHADRLLYFEIKDAYELEDVDRVSDVHKIQQYCRNE